MNANQLRIPKTLHFADEISQLNNNFLSVNSYSQASIATAPTGPRSINKFIRSNSKFFSSQKNSSTGSLIYDIIDLYLLPDTAPDEQDKKIPPLPPLSSEEDPDPSTALFASLHKGYHYFFGADFLPNTSSSIIASAQSLENDANEGVVIGVSDGKDALYRNDDTNNKSISFLWWKTTSSSTYSDDGGEEGVDAKLKSLFSDETIDENDLAQEFMDPTSSSSPPSQLDPPKRRVTIQENAEIIYPDVNYHKRQHSFNIKRNFGRKISFFKKNV
ncbi:hypothetical protein SBY92_004557 [Candida maltosa Xu316]